MSSTISSSVSGSSSALYNHENIAAFFEGRGLLRRPYISHQDVAISFDTEWNKLYKVVQAITKDQGGDQAEPDVVWETYFGPVMKAQHKGENEFSANLFFAFRDSLGKCCDEEESNETEIHLRGSTIGFAAELTRDKLGLSQGNAKSTKSRADHACVIFASTGSTANVADATAVVELKHMYTGCAAYTEGESLDLSNKHGPLVQAVAYTMDSLHCLARRGHMAKSLPVVVLAGKVISDKAKKEAIKLCCMEATLTIPNEMGDPFSLQVKRCVRFSSDPEEEDGLMKKAIAIYLHTMKTGLDHARHMLRTTAVPKSLCCYTPIKGLKLIASPIPEANPFPPPTPEANPFPPPTPEATPFPHLIPEANPLQKLTINQGELYRWTGNPNMTVSQWIDEIQGETVDFENANNTQMNGCLVKISHKMVHSCLLPLQNSWDAINAASGSLKGGVLLACVFHEARSALFTVMKDLSSPEEKFQPLNCVAFTDGGALWNGVHELVNTVLLPLAAKKIVHIDIRCCPVDKTPVETSGGPVKQKSVKTDPPVDQHYFVYNILGRTKQCGTVALQLIDFESLCFFGNSSDVEQKFAISPPSFNEHEHTAYHFVFWQVLWIAHAVYVTHFFHGKNQYPMMKASAYDFVEVFLSADDEFKDFRDWIGKETSYLKLKAALFQLNGVKKAEETDQTTFVDDESGAQLNKKLKGERKAAVVDEEMKVEKPSNQNAVSEEELKAAQPLNVNTKVEAELLATRQKAVIEDVLKILADIFQSKSANEGSNGRKADQTEVRDPTII